MAFIVRSPQILDVAHQARADRARWRVAVSGMGVLTFVVAAIAHATAPEGLSLATLLLVVSCGAALAYPPAGVYLLVFFTLLGDDTTAKWWPFTKNFSSPESAFFVDDRLSLNPLEVVLGVTIAAWLMRAAADRSWRFRAGALFVPFLAFFVCVSFGFLRGQAAGGDRNVAIMEARPLFYLPVMYVLMTNLFTTRQQYRRAFSLALVAVAIQSVFTIGYFRSLDPIRRGAIEDLTEHPASVTMNVLFVFVACLLAFRGSRWKLWAFALMMPTVLTAYILSQRRAAMVGLFAGMIVLAAVLYYRRRRAFRRWTPIVAVLLIGFIAATWNKSGGIGLPANAVKTVLFPGSLGDVDVASDTYRQLEAYNLWFTIRTSPLTGYGFGQRFLVVRPMPDISFFEFWQYLPHNSVLWIWIKTGFFGFVAMLFMFARTVQLGGRSARRVLSSDDAAIVTSALAYVVMFVVFAYVDIAWGIRQALMLALCGALCADFERLEDRTPLTGGPVSATGRDGQRSLRLVS